MIMKAQALNIGIIGAGRIGRVHAENLSLRIPRANILIVADVAEASARDCAQLYRIPQAVGDYRAVLANPDIDAVLICSATDTHARMIEEAAQQEGGALAAFGFHQDVEGLEPFPGLHRVGVRWIHAPEGGGDDVGEVGHPAMLMAKQNGYQRSAAKAMSGLKKRC